jgi:hypothetical protein
MELQWLFKISYRVEHSTGTMHAHTCVCFASPAQHAAALASDCSTVTPAGDTPGTQEMTRKIQIMCT